MLPQGLTDRAFFPPTLIIEALAQSCGFLMKLRWLASQGIDITAFADGDDSVVAATRIPYSVLAETRMRQLRSVHAEDSLRMNIRVTMQRHLTVRFAAEAFVAGNPCTELDVLLAFPEYTLLAAPRVI